MTVDNGRSEELTDEDEVLLRQVHPALIDEQTGIMSTAFVPTMKDAGRLSTLRESVGAEQAYVRWVTLGLLSAGTWGVAVREAKQQALVCIDDSGESQTPRDHASIVFEGLSKGESKRAGRLLKDAASSRGCLHDSMST